MKNEKKEFTAGILLLLAFAVWTVLIQTVDGGMCEINGQWYVFYHRQTNKNSYARQACAEKLERTADGGFKQAEVTSCGLNDGPLRGTEQKEST